MLRRFYALGALAPVAVALCLPPPASARDTGLTASLKKGTVELKSAGPLAFGPQGILFVGDPQAATIYAVATGDTAGPNPRTRPSVEGIDEKVAALLGADAAAIQIKDLAVNPASGVTYLSVARGRGPGATPVILRVAGDGKLSELPLKGVLFASAAIPNAATGKKTRQEAITHLAYLKGRVLVAGLSNEEFSSKLRAIPFPFAKAGAGTGVEFYHGSHGRFETRSPIRVFTTYRIKGEDHLLAAYTCTPVVTVPLAKLEPGARVKGITVAELGNRNRPLSMIVYQKGGQDFLLMANSARGLMKIKLEGIDKIEAITSRVPDKAGLKYDTIKGVTGVQKLDAFGQDHAVVLIRSGGKLNLRTIELP